MRYLIAASRLLDWPSRLLGQGLKWLVAVMVLVQFANVALRYVFSTTRVQMQETVLYAHGILFMCLAGYAMLRNDHVRVDLFYDRAGPRTRAWIDLAGILLGVVPLCALLWWFGWPYVAASWRIREGAMFFGGLPYTYLLKTVILVFVALLAVQALAVALRCIAVIGGAKVELYDPEGRG